MKKHQKKCWLLRCAGLLLITGCAQQTFTVQNKPAAVAPKETITHHFFVSGIGQKKTVDAAKKKFVEKKLKQNPANIRKWIRKWIFGFITLGIPLAGWKRVYCHCSQ